VTGYQHLIIKSKNYVTNVMSDPELGRMDTDRIILFDDRDRWRAFVKLTTKLPVPKNTENLLSN